MDQDFLIFTNSDTTSFSNFNNPKLIIFLVIQNIILVSYVIFNIVFDHFLNTDDKKSLGFASRNSTIIYFSHFVIRVLFLLFKIYLDNNHHYNLKISGYRKFHKKTVFLSDLSHFLFNKTTLLLLLNTAIFQCLNIANLNEPIYLNIGSFTINQTFVAKFLNIIMTISITFITGKKLVIEIDFQRNRTRPDTLESIESNINQVGLRRNNCLNELLEKQHDHIVNLELRNEALKSLLIKNHERVMENY